MNEKYGFQVVGQWTFGMDIADLYRFMQLRLQKENEDILDYFHDKFWDGLDVLQRAVDEVEFADETHMIVKVNH